MFAPLRILLASLWSVGISGAVIIAALSVHIIEWQDFATALIVGLVIGIPAGIVTERLIKRNDPFWPPRQA